MSEVQSEVHYILRRLAALTNHTSSVFQCLIVAVEKRTSVHLEYRSILLVSRFFFVTKSFFSMAIQLLTSWLPWYLNWLPKRHFLKTEPQWKLNWTLIFISKSTSSKLKLTKPIQSWLILIWKYIPKSRQTEKMVQLLINICHARQLKYILSILMAFRLNILYGVIFLLRQWKCSYNLRTKSFYCIAM